MQLFPLETYQAGIVDGQTADIGVMQLGIEFLVAIEETTGFFVGVDELLDVVTLLVFEHCKLLAVGSVRCAGRS